jgi:hypothetical protein
VSAYPTLLHQYRALSGTCNASWAAQRLACLSCSVASRRAAQRLHLGNRPARFTAHRVIMARSAPTCRWRCQSGWRSSCTSAASAASSRRSSSTSRGCKVGIPHPPTRLTNELRVVSFAYGERCHVIGGRAYSPRRPHTFPPALAALITAEQSDLDSFQPVPFYFMEVCCLLFESAKDAFGDSFFQVRAACLGGVVTEAGGMLEGLVTSTAATCELWVTSRDRHAGDGCYAAAWQPVLMNVRATKVSHPGSNGRAAGGHPAARGPHHGCEATSILLSLARAMTTLSTPLTLCSLPPSPQTRCGTCCSSLSTSGDTRSRTACEWWRRRRPFDWPTCLRTRPT